MKTTSVAKLIQNLRSTILKPTLLILSLGVTEYVFAGNLDGIEIVLPIAVGILILALACWTYALIQSIRLMKGKSINRTRLLVAQVTLFAVSLIVFTLYTGKPAVQLTGSLFFVLPLLVLLLGLRLRKSNKVETGPNS